MDKCCQTAWALKQYFVWGFLHRFVIHYYINHLHAFLYLLRRKIKFQKSTSGSKLYHLKILSEKTGKLQDRSMQYCFLDKSSLKKQNKIKVRCTTKWIKLSYLNLKMLSWKYFHEKIMYRSFISGRVWKSDGYVHHHLSEW